MIRTPRVRSRRRFESLETRCVLSVTLGDLTAAGISQRVVDYIDTSTYESQILGDDTLANTLIGLRSTQTAPQDATVLDSVADLAQITAGTVANPNVYLIQGDLTLTNTIAVPSNVHIYVDGSLFRQGSFVAPGGVHSVENTGTNADAIFRLNGSDNVKLIGVNDALLHSTPNLDVNSPHTTAVFIGGGSHNVEVDGFEMAYVWNGVAAHPFNIRDVTITNNYIHDTLDRGIWSLGTTNLRAAHNFVENTGIDSLDWDAFTNDAIGYENVSIGAGRFAGFVEEGTEDSYFIRGLAMIADFGNPNRGFMLGWADNGSSQNFVSNNPNPSEWTEHNYFIDNVVFTEGNVPQSGGDYFAKENAGKGPTYFWANRGFGAGQSTNFFFDAEWLTFLPTAGGRNNAVNAVQLLADLDAEFNQVTGIVLSAPLVSVPDGAPIGSPVGVVTPLNADVAALTFEIVAGNPGGAFAIDESGVLTVAGPIAFATQSSYTLTVEATDGSEVGSTEVLVTVVSPFATVKRLFDHDFAAPVFSNAADLRGQQGWTAQNGWSVIDASGFGYATSSSTAFQGVTNNTIGRADAGETLRVEIDFDIEVTQDTTSDQFRFGVTTLDASGNFVPAVGNNGGSFLSAKVRYAAGDGGLELFPEEDSGTAISLPGALIGIDRGAGDNQTDPLRATWEATKSETSGQWDVTLAVENLATGQRLGEQAVTVDDDGVYDASTGLFAGVRTLQNASQSVFRIDRFAYQTIDPGSAIAGDYNADGTVNAADYTIWRDAFGQTGESLPADGDRDGEVDLDDHRVWAENYGQVAAASAALGRSTAAPTAAAEASGSVVTTPATNTPIPSATPVAFARTVDAATGSAFPSSVTPEPAAVVATARDASLLLLSPDQLADESPEDIAFASEYAGEAGAPTSAVDEAFGLSPLVLRQAERLG
ncbi:cadherin domain-containing protein [Botrimarina hoheduenensis]|uniref:Cadherin domain protein n=1 Tax=Botrimarina hoheduenensis TaxID=2528000 RepID=A0A5C5VPY9_9BACT|nr:cadherin domain-containing protein [Botrimarina hoheduenensis]TWT40644.1 Cadherin domain protein [Botrimarina hoheduenensis]